MTVKEEIQAKKRSIVVDTEDEEEETKHLTDSLENEKNPENPGIPENPNPGLLAYLMINHQWIFAIWLVPISVIYDIFLWFRTRVNFLMCRRNSNLRHDEKVT